MNTHIKKVIGLVIILSCLLGGVGYAQGELTLEGLAERLGLVETRTDELAGRVATLESHLLSTTVEDHPDTRTDEKTGRRTTVTAEGTPIATQAVTAIPDVCSNSSALPDPEPASLVADCNILLAAKNTLDPSGVLNWHQDKLIFQWDGVVVGKGNSVRKLDFSDNDLTGEIPAALGNLSNLESLDLSDNDLTGEIPAALGNLSKLKSLDFSDNDLTGEIPAVLGNLSNLESLSLSHNNLTGEIPAVLGNLSNLVLLGLADNNLMGEIPAALGNLSNLESLHLPDNDLMGEIPAALGNLSNLKSLSLSGNDLTGEIPAVLGNLSNLESLSLSHNNLTGEIPAVLGNLSNLVLLGLSDNNLTGEIPATLGNLSNLKWWLSLSHNNLTGEIPATLGNLSNLKWWLDLSGNDLTGEIPAALGNLSNLKSLGLSDNDLTGEIPAELGNLSNLESLGLSENDLTGEIPAALGNLSNLKGLHLSDNDLTGPIPPTLGNIDTLDLYGNESLGCLPNTFPVYREDMIHNQQAGMSFCDAETPTAISTGDTKSTPMAISMSEGADQIDWETLFRYNEEHVGKSVAFKGNVLQVIQVEELCFLGVCITNFSAIDDATEGDVALRVAVTRSSYGSWDDAVMLFYRSPPTRILKDDLIEFVAEVKGLYSYDAVMGNEVTIPLLEVTQLRLIEEN